MSKHSLYQITLPQINDNSIKEIIGKYIYSLIDLKKYKYTVINTIDDLHILKSQKYYVSLNFCGLNCLYVFIKIRDKYFSVIIDKKTLSFNQSQVIFSNIKMYYTTIRLDESIYDGTIMDGIFIDNEQKFIVNDIFYFRGTNLTDDKISNKLINIKVFLDATMKQDDLINNIMVTTNKFFELCDIEKIINAPIMKKKNIVRGLLFYPDLSGISLVYVTVNKTSSELSGIDKIKTFDDNKTSDKITRKNIEEVVKEKMDSPKFINKYKIKTTKEIYATFEIKKTDITDVYKLFLAATEIKNGKPQLRGKKIDIAFIPTTECSAMCNSLFENSAGGMQLVKCLFDKNHGKWIPIERDNTKKHPTLISEIESFLEINDIS